MCEGNPGEVDFSSRQREVRVGEGSSYWESTVQVSINFLTTWVKFSNKHRTNKSKSNKRRGAVLSKYSHQQYFDSSKERQNSFIVWSLSKGFRYLQRLSLLIHPLQIPEKDKSQKLKFHKPVTSKWITIESLRFWVENDYDYDFDFEIFSILRIAHAWTSILLSGNRDSRRHSTTSFSENVVVAGTSYQI